MMFTMINLAIGALLATLMSVVCTWSMGRDDPEVRRICWQVTGTMLIVSVIGFIGAAAGY